jgi:hypothetical protein
VGNILVSKCERVFLNSSRTTCTYCTTTISALNVKLFTRLQAETRRPVLSKTEGQILIQDSHL